MLYFGDIVEEAEEKDVCLFFLSKNACEEENPYKGKGSLIAVILIHLGLQNSDDSQNKSNCFRCVLLIW